MGRRGAGCTGAEAWAADSRRVAWRGKGAAAGEDLCAGGAEVEPGEHEHVQNFMNLQHMAYSISHSA